MDRTGQKSCPKIMCVCFFLHYMTLAGSAEALRLPSKQLCAAVRCCALLCAAVRCCALLCAAVRCCALRKLLRHARLVQNTSNRAGSTSANGASVRCMDAAWRGADGSSTQQPKLYDCRRSSTCSDGFTTNVACRRSFRCSCAAPHNLLRKLLRHVRDERSLPPKHSLLCAALRCTTQTY